MQRDNKLTHTLLTLLQELEASKQPGDTLVLVQPHYEEVQVPDGFKIDGYTGHQIDEQLRLMIADRLIVGSEAGIGIHFEHLTSARAGHAFLKNNK